MAAANKLELSWVGKGHRPRIEPRILLEDDRLSYASAERRSDSRFDNILIKGDNLLSLRALEHDFAGAVKCICIDPPYNTGSAIRSYDDGVEHSLWLSLIRERLEIMSRLLSEDGSIWIFIDDNEHAYLKILCDEIFGRSNFVQSLVWQRKASPANDAKWFSYDHDYILIYAKNKDQWRLNRLARDESNNSYYKNPDDDPRGPWNSATYTCNKTAEERPNLYYGIVNPNTGEEVWPSRTAVWRSGPKTTQENQANNLLYWGKDGRSRMPRLKKFLDDAKPIVPRSVWLYDEVGHTQSAMLEQKALNADEPFATPKPEAVIRKVLELATNAGDLVLDSFAGSGTTGAVAHKMGRRWIMVELGDHCETHIVPRLKKVIDGEDPGGITEAVGWKGGGGYRYYKLAPSLLEKDQFGNWVISKSYNAEMLAEAMCKHFGFTYAPSAEHYWMHGHSSETDFIYVTTNSLTHEQLAAISDEVGPERTLLICCKAFQGGNADAFRNLTIRKIPGAILDRCEWGKDDYSLKIEALPLIEDEPEEAADEAPRRKSAGNPNQPGLFNGDEEAGE